MNEIPSISDAEYQVMKVILTNINYKSIDRFGFYSYNISSGDKHELEDWYESSYYK